MSHDDWRHVDRDDDDDCKLRWHAILQLQFAYKYPLHKNYLWRITNYHSVRPLILRETVFSHAFLQTPSIQFSSIQKNDEFSFCFIDFLPQSCQEHSSKVVLLSGFFFFWKKYFSVIYIKDMNFIWVVCAGMDQWRLLGYVWRRLVIGHQKDRILEREIEIPGWGW